MITHSTPRRMKFERLMLLPSSGNVLHLTPNFIATLYRDKVSRA